MAEGILTRYKVWTGKELREADMRALEAAGATRVIDYVDRIHFNTTSLRNLEANLPSSMRWLARDARPLSARSNPRTNHSSRTVYQLLILKSPSSPSARWSVLTGGRGRRSDPLEYGSLASARRARDRIVSEFRSNEHYGHGGITIGEKFGDIFYGEIRGF